MTRGWLPQRAGSPSLNGGAGGAAAAVPRACILWESFPTRGEIHVFSVVKRVTTNDAGQSSYIHWNNLHRSVVV